MAPELREADLAAVREQLGREPTVPFEVVARCGDGHPLVIRNASRDADGTPFPTTFWLTCPAAAKAVSRVESAGGIRELNERFDADDTFRAAVERAHAEAAKERARDLPEAEAWGGVGGTRRGLKCLHAHYANRLGGGDDAVGEWVAKQIEPIHGPGGRRVAAIDQGTNSIRLLVVEAPEDGDPVELARDLVITRLGQGVDATGSISADALARTERVLARYCRRARALGAERVRVAATSAVRDAANRDAYARIVRARVESELEVIDGQTEAGLSYLGATRGLPADDGPFLVVDIGGGSTEFVVGSQPGTPDGAISTQMGSVRLTERFVRDDTVAPVVLEQMAVDVHKAIDEAEVAVPAMHTARTFVSVAGTATTLQAVALGLTRYDPDRTHRTWLSFVDVERLTDRLAAMSDAERAAIPVMAPGRGDVIVAGAVVLREVMRRFGFERTLVSETDILDGLVFDMLGVR